MLQIEREEARERGFFGAMVATQNRLIAGSFYDPDEVELLSGPRPDKAFRPIETFTDADNVLGAGVEEEDKVDHGLTRWYFSQIDYLRELCHLLVKAYNQGHQLYVRDLLQVKLWAADLDTRAEMCGWDFSEGRPTAFERICSDIEPLQKTVVRAFKIRREKRDRAVYLQRIRSMVAKARNNR